jgi:hypothetical protein
MMGEAQRGLDRYPVAMTAASTAFFALAAITIVQAVISLLH